MLSVAESNFTYAVFQIDYLDSTVDVMLRVAFKKG